MVQAKLFYTALSRHTMVTITHDNYKIPELEFPVYLEKLSSNLGLMNWKACMRVTVSWVRIPSFPPFNL